MITKGAHTMNTKLLLGGGAALVVLIVLGIAFGGARDEDRQG